MGSTSQPSIRQISEYFVKPKEVNEEAKKPYHLSAFEVFHSTQCYIQVGFMFAKNASKEKGDKKENDIKDFLDKLKESLSITLTHFYPLAGQLVTEVDEDKHTSHILVDCNKGPGAKLVHATLDNMTISDILSPKDIPAIVESFFELGRVPINHEGHEIPLLTAQVTELVDGIFLGISVNQVVVDEVSCWHLINIWSETFKSSDSNIRKQPIYKDRLYPRDYGVITLPFLHPNEVVQKQLIDGPLREMIFAFTSESMSNLRKKANEESGLENEITSHEALFAVVWRAITRARGLKNDDESSCAVVSNVRPVLDPPLTQEYFGNFISPVIKTISSGELLAKSLGQTAMMLHQANKEQLTNEYIYKDVIKWFDEMVFLPPGLPQPGFVVILASPEEKAYEIEFGLGKPLAIRTGSNKHDGKVVVHPGKEGKGSMDVEISLSFDAMKALEQDKEFTSFCFFENSKDVDIGSGSTSLDSCKIEQAKDSVVDHHEPVLDPIATKN